MNMAVATAWLLILQQSAHGRCTIAQDSFYLNLDAQRADSCISTQSLDSFTGGKQIRIGCDV